MEQPVFETERLVLRPFTLDDVADVARLAGDPLIANTTANIPHPYAEKDANTWISTHAEAFTKGTLLNAAVTDRGDGTLYGAVGLDIRAQHDHAELGYWVGVPYWGRGYATEASRALLGWALLERGLHRVFARYMTRNPASGRVMEKLGMTFEGTMRDQWRSKVGAGYDDISVHGILASELGASEFSS